MMKMRRLTAFVTLVVFMFSCFVVTVSADTTAVKTTSVTSTGTAFADVTTDTQYAQAIQKLFDDGIVDGYLAEDGTRTYKPLDTITRGEFTKLLVASKTKGIPGALNATTCGFADVNADPTVSWTIPYVDYAVKASIVNGYEDGTFRAKNTVTYAEAVKMVVCAMGYASVIEKTEPWYNGYLKLAQQIGILNGAYSDADLAAPRGLVAQLIYNMNTSNKEISVLPGGNTIIGGSDNFGFEEDVKEYESTGLVSAVFDRGVEGDANLKRTQILVDDEIYDIGNYDADSLYKYIGYNIDVTYIEDGSKKIIRKISTTGLNETTELTSDDIEDVYGSYLTYYKSETSTKVTNLKFESNLNIIHNGVGVPDVNDDLIKTLLNIDNGSVKFVDGDGNGLMDTAFITTYETFFVSTVGSDSDRTITDKYVKVKGLPKSITLDEENIEFKTHKGVSSSFGAIKTNTVVSIARPYNTSTDYGKTSVTITKDNTKTGVVKGIDGDTYTIGTTDIKASKYYLNLIENDPSQKLEIGDSATYYLDHENKLVAISVTDTNKYGYITDVIEPENSNRDDVTIMLITSSNSTPEEYGLNTKVYVNGFPYKPSEVAAVLKDSADVINVINGKEAAGLADNADYAQPIIFKTKTSDKTVITSITTVSSKNGSEESYLEYSVGAVKGDAMLKYTSSNVFKDGDGKAVFNMTFTKSSTNNITTKVFVVPADRSDESDYSVKTSASYFTDSKSYYVEAFNVDPKTKNAQIVVVYGGAPVEVTGDASAAVITQITDVMNSKDEKAKKISYYTLGSSDKEIKEVVTDVTAKVDGLKAGDIIKFAKKDDLVVLIEKVVVDGVLYNPLKDDRTQTEAGSLYIQKLHNGDAAYYNAYMGTVYSFDGSQLQLIKNLKINPASTEEQIAEMSKEVLTVSSSASVYVIDSSATKIEEMVKRYDSAETVMLSIAVNGVSNASKVFVSRIGSTGNISSIVIYK